MTTTRQQRSPMGAFYRTPMGAFGPGEEPPPVGLRNVQGFVSSALFDQNGSIGRYQFSGIDDGNVNCQLSIDFISPGRGFLYSQLNIQGHLGTINDPNAPNIVDLWDYTFIGQTSDVRHKLSDLFPDIGCTYQHPNPAQFSTTTRWIGGPPVPFSYPDLQEPGCYTRNQWEIQIYPNSSCTVIFGSERGDTTGHPVGFLGNGDPGGPETIIGYPVGAVPPL